MPTFDAAGVAFDDGAQPFDAAGTSTTVSPVGIAGGGGRGLPSLAGIVNSVVAIGVASTATPGSPRLTVPVPQTVTLTGPANVSAVGTPVLAAVLNTVTPVGRASTLTVGTPTQLRSGGIISITARATTAAFGSPNVVPGLQTVSLSSVPTRAMAGQLPLVISDPGTTTDTGWELQIRSRINPDVVIAYVPRWLSIEIVDALSDVGGGRVSLALNDPYWIENAALLDADHLWCLAWRGQVVCAFIAEDEPERSVDPGTGAAVVTLAGRGPAAMLETAVVLPDNYPDHTTTQRTLTGPAWTSLRTLLAEAQTRGAAAGYTCLFTASSDSTGQAWRDPATSMTVNAGSTLLSVLQDVAALTDTDWRVTWRGEIVAGYDLGRQVDTAVLFPLGAQSRQMRAKTRRQIAGVVYAADSTGATTEVVSSASVTTWGRRETWIGLGNTSDALTRAAYATATLGLVSDQRESITVELDVTTPGRRIFVDWNVGDTVAVERLDGTRESQQVRAYAVRMTGDGPVEVQATLKSLLTTAQERLTRALDRLGNGGVRVPSSASTPPPPPPPSPPPAPGMLPVVEGVAVSTGALVDESWIDVTWTAVDPDTQALLSGFQVRATRTLDSTTVEVIVPGGSATTTRLGPLPAGVVYDVQVRVLTSTGVAGDWTNAVRVTTALDSTPPAQPSAPTLTSGIGSVFATWTAVADPDVAYYEVALASDAGFGVGQRSVRVLGTITAWTDLTPGSTYYVRVRAVDTSGLAGPWSLGASATALLVGSGAIGEGAVGALAIGVAAINTAAIADAAIVNAKIADSAIDSAKIQELTVSKITGGTLGVTVALGSQGSLTALQGMGGLTIDSNGLRLKDNVGIVVVDLNAATGNARFVGTVQGSNIVGGSITIGSGNNVLRADSTGLWAGHVDQFSAPFVVTPDGVLHAQGAKIVGEITSASSVTGTLSIQVDGKIQSSNYVAGVDGAGFRLNADGTAELSQAVVRGTVDAATITGSSIIGSSLEGGSIRIGPTANDFYVDATGAIRFPDTLYVGGSNQQLKLVAKDTMSTLLHVFGDGTWNYLRIGGQTVSHLVYHNVGNFWALEGNMQLGCFRVQGNPVAVARPEQGWGARAVGGAQGRADMAVLTVSSTGTAGAWNFPFVDAGPSGSNASNGFRAVFYSRRYRATNPTQTYALDYPSNPERLGGAFKSDQAMTGFDDFLLFTCV